jgi:hypothetical protein
MGSSIPGVTMIMKAEIAILLLLAGSLVRAFLPLEFPGIETLARLMLLDYGDNKIMLGIKMRFR